MASAVSTSQKQNVLVLLSLVSLRGLSGTSVVFTERSSRLSLLKTIDSTSEILPEDLVFLDFPVSISQK